MSVPERSDPCSDVPVAGEASRVASPCIGVCAMDARRRHCIGCLRTLDEIAGWLAFTDDERRVVLRRLAARRAAAAPGTGGAP